MMHNLLYNQAIKLLKKLIVTPSNSGEEKQVADQIEFFLNDHFVPTTRYHHNVWCYNKYFDASKPTILLNSHHDTVKPNEQYTLHPYDPLVKDGKLFGLGSNDAGGALVALASTFLYFYERSDLPYNLCFAATAEEENSGERGIRSILNRLRPIAFAIIGEPTQMHLAIAEKGSMVIDCLATGKSGHAAREEGINAIYKAIKDIEWFVNYDFPIESNLPKPVKMTVTEINGGVQHNVIPGECTFTVDIRFDHSYTPKEIMNVIHNHTFCETKVRPNVLNPSVIDLMHPLVLAGVAMGRKTYSSPTSSDQGWLTVPSVKLGPGDSARSHTANEFIFLIDVEQGIEQYIQLLESLPQYILPMKEVSEEIN